MVANGCISFIYLFILVWIGYHCLKKRLIRCFLSEHIQFSNTANRGRHDDMTGQFAMSRFAFGKELFFQTFNDQFGALINYKYESTIATVGAPFLKGMLLEIVFVFSGSST